MSKYLECSPENTERFFEWLTKRGGIAVWPSADLSDLTKSWSTPALDKDGQPTTRPHWQAASKPSRVITSPDDVRVIFSREVKRFRVAVRRGSQGFKLKLTDGSTRKLHKELERAGEGSSYEFDYATQEAVIFVSDRSIPLLRYLEQTHEISPVAGETEVSG